MRNQLNGHLQRDRQRVRDQSLFQRFVAWVRALFDAE
jgi:hypothetical protein